MKLTGIALALAFAFATAAQAQMTQTPATKADPAKPRTEQTIDASKRKAKDAEEERIEATAKSDKANCQPMKGNAKDICMQEAKVKEKVAKAELDAKYAKDMAKAQKKVDAAKAEAVYDVAKQKCDDQKGEAKDACMKMARVERDKAKGKAEKTAEAKERPAGAGQTTSPEKPKKSN
jgi:hypothetical protein